MPNPQNVTGMGTSFNLPNYSGLLATASKTQTPFLSMVLSKPMRTITTVDFTTSSDYTLPDPSANGISENAAADIKTNVTATNIGRGQQTNIVQTFTDRVSITYIKEATNGQMSGLNIAGQQNNVNSELAFQRSMVLKKNARNIEYAFLNGTYNKATNAGEVNKTRGILNAIPTENIVADAGELTQDVFESLPKKLYDNGAYLENVYIFVNSSAKKAISKIYNNQKGFGLPASRTVGGLNIQDVVTDFGTFSLVLDPFMPQDTILFADMNYVRPVQLLTKGSNFYFEELAKSGASYDEMFYGNIGLDYGPAFLHGKITGITYSEEVTQTSEENTEETQG